MRVYIENARKKKYEMDIENLRFHAEMKRVELINNSISNLLLTHAGSNAVLACSGVLQDSSQR